MQTEEQNLCSLCYPQVHHLLVFNPCRGDQLVVEPEEIKKLLQVDGKEYPKDIFVLPWLTEEVQLDVILPEKLKKTLNFMNALVEQINKEDPW